MLVCDCACLSVSWCLTSKMRSEVLRATRECWDRKFEAGWLTTSEASPSLMRFVVDQRARIGRSVLDLGCGRGRNLIPLVERGLDVVGIDLSSKGLEMASHELRRRGLHAALVQGSSHALPFRSQSFDFVVAMGTIHHNFWADIESSFAEVARVLRPGRCLFFKCRADDDNEQSREQVSDCGRTAIDTAGSKRGIVQHYFSHEELQQLANDFGFDILGSPVKKVHLTGAKPELRQARWQVVFEKRAAQGAR